VSIDGLRRAGAGRTLLITGASGRLGRRVAELLLDAGEAPVLVTRRPAVLDDLAARGAVVRAGDFDAPDGLPAAFAGGDRLLLVSTDALDRRVRQHQDALDAAVAAGIGHVVYTSLSDPVPANPARLVTDAHRHTEAALRARAPQWTILRHATYADALVPLWQRAAAQGRLVTNLGDGRTAWVARDDCAAVAAAVLRGDGHEGLTYDVTGPERLGADDLAGLLGVPVAPVTDAGMVAHLVADGLPPHRAELVATWHRAIREGFFTPCTTTIPDLLTRPATPLATLLTER